MSSMPERQELRDAIPPRLLVAVPATDKTGPSRSRRIAAGMLLLGIVLGLSVVVAAFLDRGHGSSPPSRAHGAATPAKSVVLPVVIGAHVELATSVLRGEGFPVQVRTVSGSSPAGMVVGQTPSGGRPVARSTRVLLTVSSGS
jgi:PASTA domain